MKLRIRHGLRPGSPFNRQGLSAWPNQLSTAPAGVNAVEEPQTGATKDYVAPLADETREDLALTGETGENA